MSEKEKLMTLLNVSEAEALDIMAYDKAVESGKATEYDLTAEQKKVASEMSKTGTRVYNFTTKREKKVNEIKVELINHLAEQLVNFGVKNLTLINAERQIGFSIGENDYELTLTHKRKQK